MVLMLDNYDSFTYNLVQYLLELGQEVQTWRNDEVGIADIEKLHPSHIVISPGPCDPDQAGISLAVLDRFAGEIPIFGVCLGHQSIGQYFGGKVVRAREVMHGKTSPIYHAGKGVFRGMPSPITQTRYHSLIVEANSLPDCLEVTAWTQLESGERDEIMGVRHKTLPVEGVQFHPESILSEYGHRMLQNFLEDNA